MCDDVRLRYTSISVSAAKLPAAYCSVKTMNVTYENCLADCRSYSSGDRFLY